MEKLAPTMILALIFSVGCSPGGSAPAPNVRAATTLPSHEAGSASGKLPDDRNGLTALVALEARGENDSRSPCVAFHLGDGRFLTAAHCVKSMRRGAACADSLLLRWSRAGDDPKALLLSPGGPRCARVSLYASDDRGEASDLALIQTELDAPSEVQSIPKLTLRAPPRLGAFLVWVFGHDASVPDVLPQSYGNSLEVGEKTLLSVTVGGGPGFSGAPVLAERADQDLGSFHMATDISSKLADGAVGMHVSSQGTQRVALLTSQIEALLAMGPVETFP